MAPMSDEEFRKARRKVRDAMMRLARWKLREMRDKYIGRPRARRLGKEARALKALLRRAEGAQESEVPKAREREVPKARKHQTGATTGDSGK